MVAGLDPNRGCESVTSTPTVRGVTISCDGGHCAEFRSYEQSRIPAQDSKARPRRGLPWAKPGCCSEFGRYVFLILGPPRGGWKTGPGVPRAG